MANVAVTELAQLAIGASDPVDTPLNFADFDPGYSIELRDCNGSRGTFHPDSNRIRVSRKPAFPTYTNEPTAGEWASLLPWIMSGTPTGSGTVTYPFANAAALRYLYWFPNFGDQFFLDNVAVDNATLSATAGEPLRLAMDMVGIGTDDTRNNYPALTVDRVNQPYMLSDLALTFNGTSRYPRSISLGISNGIDRTRFFASLTLNTIVKLSARFSLSLEIPSGDAAGVYKAATTSSVTATATFTNPASSAVMVWSFGALRFPGRAPTFQRGQDGWVTIQAQCCRSGSGGAVDPVVITNNLGS